jgi:genome maintenance exonuclease 1
MKTFIHHDLPKLERDTKPDGTRVYKTPSGNSYPSITSVTGLYNKQSMMEWRKRVGEEEANKISARASKRGTAIHSLCEDYLKNKEVSPELIDVEMWNSIRPVLKSINNIHALESPLYSDHLEVAGTVDCVAEYEGRLSIIDFKTSSRVKTREQIHNYFMQCSAYAVAFEERTKIPVSRLVIIMAVEDSDPLLFVEKRDTWISGFLQLREEYRKWKNI